MIKKPFVATLSILAGLSVFACEANASASPQNPLKQYTFHDLSHVTPMFAPLNGDSTKADVNQPMGISKPVAGSGGALGVRTSKRDLILNNGEVHWGFIYMDEHYGTHVDSTHHFVTTNPKLMNVKKADERSTGEFTLQELIGPLVYIDISSRVKKELAKNGGKPSIDIKVTNFDNDSGNSISVDDINAVADQLVDGAYIVINTGWAQFYESPPVANNWHHPYNNNLNYPGITPAATDRLIELENERGIRIAGIVADTIGVESGHSVRGNQSADGVNPREFDMYMHAVGLPRGWKIVENATNLSVLNQYGAEDCTLIIGAPKLEGTSGSPARLIAMCNK